MATSAAFVAVPVVALAMVGTLGNDRFSATEVSTAAPATTAPEVIEVREAVPEPRTLAEPKGVAVVAPPTTTTTAPPPPPTTVPPAPAPAPHREQAPEPAPAPAAAPAPAPVRAPAAAPAPAPRPAPRPAPAPPGSVSANLDAIAQCESGRNPDAYNPAGYYGAFQFSLPTWRGLGFLGDPRDYTYEEQKFGAWALLNRSGYGQWPSCARQLGLI